VHGAEDETDIWALAQVGLRNEDDVREEFVTPLLRLLGYQHTLGDILRAEALSTSYRSGTKRKEYIVPDYIARTELGSHLVVDAKGPGSTPEEALRMVLDPQYVGQVHSYAAHREVRAPRFAVINGKYVAVYETDSSSSDPLLLVAQAELPDRIKELQSAIGKQATARELARRIQPSWSTQLSTQTVGFQPMNLDVGDINNDGLPEIAVAISENRVPVLDLAGRVVADVVTGGWAWWLKFTGATGSGLATLVVLQHQSGPTDTSGRLLGIDRDGVLWEHRLERAGSGFEDLDRLLIDGSSGVVVGPASDLREYVSDHR